MPEEIHETQDYHLDHSRHSFIQLEACFSLLLSSLVLSSFFFTSLLSSCLHSCSLLSSPFLSSPPLLEFK